MTTDTISRAQYEAALARLPDPQTYPEPGIDIGADADGPYPETILFFELVSADGSRPILKLAPVRWELSTGYQIHD